MHYPPKVYEAIMGRSDGDMWADASETTPPVTLPD
jgi:hypothetical protein